MAATGKVLAENDGALRWASVSSKRPSLPLLSSVPEKAAPTLALVRERLGGRALSQPGMGEVVRYEPRPGQVMVGVVLFVDDRQADILLGERGIVHRARRDALTPLGEPPTEELLKLAADVRVFAALSEGDEVLYVDAKGELGQGVLVEKCRYGGLVARKDEVVMGVGFRKLWPHVDRAAAE